MTDVLLGLIAFGVLTTAVLQVVVIVTLARTARRVAGRIERLRALVEPLPAHLAAIREHVGRAQSIADRQLGQVARIYDAVEPPVRHGLTLLAVLRGVSRAAGRFRR